MAARKHEQHAVPRRELTHNDYNQPSKQTKGVRVERPLQPDPPQNTHNELDLGEGWGRSASAAQTTMGLKGPKHKRTNTNTLNSPHLNKTSRKVNIKPKLPKQITQVRQTLT